MNELHNYIHISPKVVTDDALTVVLDFCREYAVWKLSSVGLDGTVDASIRNSHISHISAIPECSHIDQLLYAAFRDAMPDYIAQHPAVSLDSDTGFDLLKYEMGGFYKWHTDHFEKHPRSLSALIFLNDDFRGGLLEFEGLTVKPEAGRVVIFPSNFMFPHRVTEVEDGTRYTCVTWFI